MKPTSLLLCLCTSLATASPFVPRQDRGSYIVPGFGSRKQAVISTGGTSLDLAVAMLETDSMTTDYACGDNKSGDSWDLNADVTARRECQDYYGYDKWFAGHRNGASGLNNPNTQDIANYKTAVQWIQSQIDSDSRFRTDDTRFWVDVPAI
ncbi:hypothetical protein H2199_000801 [Coniosporium tulheliwenetii]|uniref:Uncharacterized protein n=1 Tax=Coniosporium tulheliwenetii TaxID=3383036 RepID=A0ACC2ZND4_9PEZI|nr:hypothetical protein H2199_000801 [Cladosporium sp. JES 115]